MMKKLVRTVVCLLGMWGISVAGAFAQTGKYLMLHFKSGNKICVSIDETPKMVFEAGSLWIGGSAFAVADVRKYTVESDITGLDEVRQEELLVMEKGQLIFRGDTRKPLRLYDTGGKELPVKTVATGTRSVVIETRHLAPGIYLLTTGDETIKFRIQ